MPRRRNRQLLPDDQIADIVYNDICWATDFRQHYEDKWRRFYTIYKNYINQAKYPFAANVAIPSAFATIAVQKAFLLDLIMSGGSFVEVMGKTPEGQAQAGAVHDLLDYHFRNSFRTYEDWDQFIDQLLIYGTSIYKVYWMNEMGWKTQSNIVYGEDGEVTGVEKILSPSILANKPFGYTVDNFNFGVDPNASHIEQARFAFEDMWLDPIKLRELEQQDIGFRNIDDAIRMANNTNRGVADRLEELNIPHYQSPPEYTTAADARSKVHVVDYWGYLVKGHKDGRIKKSAMQQLYHVMAALPGTSTHIDADPIVIFAEPSPFYHNKIPYVDARINAGLGEFYGTGDIEFCESLFLEQRDLRNIELDNLSMTINKMFKVRKSAGINPNELVWRPGGIVHVNAPDDVDILETRPITPDAFRAQEDIRRDIESVTGVNDFTMGHFRSSTGFNDTATGVSLIQQVALKRINQKGQVVQRTIRDVAEIVFSLVAQYEPWGTTVRVLDRNAATNIRFLDVSPAALKDLYDFNVVSAPALGSKPIRVQQLVQLMQILIQAKQHDPNFSFDMNLFVRRIIEEMDVPNPSEFFGFEQFMQNLPPELGAPEEAGELLPPDEENRIMISNMQFVIPKLGENHPHHMIIHLEGHDSLPQEHPARQLLQKHYNAHMRLKDQTRDLMAQGLQQQSAIEGTAGARQYTAAKEERQKNLLTGNTTRSPNAAGGEEDLTRGMGNLIAGNA